MNYLVRLTENRPNGHIGVINCNEKELNNIERLSNAGGFKSFSIDILDKGKRPGNKDKKAFDNFCENIKL